MVEKKGVFINFYFRDSCLSLHLCPLISNLKLDGKNCCLWLNFLTIILSNNRISFFLIHRKILFLIDISKGIHPSKTVSKKVSKFYVKKQTHNQNKIKLKAEY